MPFRVALAASAALLLAACATPRPAMQAFDQSTLPASVQVPAGHKVALETVGVGRITYECKAKAGAAGQFEWAFVGPDARLLDRSGKQIGKYYGPPATWENMDGARLTGMQVAVAPAMAGSIPYQLVKVAPGADAGMMNGFAYIQRVATQGGVAPAMACDAGAAGRREIVNYQADYIFYKAM